MTGGCPACRARALEPLVVVERSPVLTGVLCRSREEAVRAHRLPLDLHLCGACGTVVNVAFDPGLIDYGGAYDNSLHFSATFRAYARELAERLVAEHALAGRSVVEIGSGKGDFLRELCRRGGCAGTGYDPTYVGPGRAADADVTFVVDYYGPRYGHLPADFVVCRHVLEHVPDPLAFLADIRAALGERAAGLYLEVPNGGFMLSPAGVWDYIYPHVTYFSPAGLRRVVTVAGFEVTNTGTAYGDQFLWVEARTAARPADIAARPGNIAARPGNIAPDTPDEGEDVAATRAYLARARAFEDTYRQVVGRWSREIVGESVRAPGVLVWGAGSKGVNFLNVLDPGPAVRGIVDLNPGKRGMFIPGTGHRVLAPEDVPAMAVERVLLPNSLYLNEVRALLDELGVRAEVVPL